MAVRAVRPGATAIGLRRLKRSELPVDTAALAQYLIGKTLVRESDEGRTSGRIVETEAYVPGDAAGHAYVGPTDRNRTLFLRRGHAYVYLSYGIHFCVNVSGATPGVGAGTLLRALEPLEGVPLMQARRGTLRLIDLARGPGRLGQAMAIDRALDGTDLCACGPLWLADAVRPPGKVKASVRIGISKETARLLRFYEQGNPHVSGPGALRR
ncbi:MAG: DNA-3-methyladenine glycosylase [Burkholderiales bacterium]|nr:DNA-3-methyladenine glycosylase [Burkholderiales bacterium]